MPPCDLGGDDRGPVGGVGTSFGSGSGLGSAATSPANRNCWPSIDANETAELSETAEIAVVGRELPSTAVVGRDPVAAVVGLDSPTSLSKPEPESSMLAQHRKTGKTRMETLTEAWLPRARVDLILDLFAVPNLSTTARSQCFW